MPHERSKRLYMPTRRLASNTAYCQLRKGYTCQRRTELIACRERLYMPHERSKRLYMPTRRLASNTAYCQLRKRLYMPMTNRAYCLSRKAIYASRTWLIACRMAIHANKTPRVQHGLLPVEKGYTCLRQHGLLPVERGHTCLQTWLTACKALYMPTTRLASNAAYCLLRKAIHAD